MGCSELSLAAVRLCRSYLGFNLLTSRGGGRSCRCPDSTGWRGVHPRLAIAISRHSISLHSLRVASSTSRTFFALSARASLVALRALCGDFLFCLLDKRVLSFGSGPLSRENVILLSNGGARRVLVGDGLFVPLLSTYAAKTEGI